MILSELLSRPELEDKLLNAEQTVGFVTALAAAPHLLDPNEWLAYLWGGSEETPFEDAQTFELYANLVVDEWNHAHQGLLDGSWQWPQGYDLDEEDIISDAVRDFAEGLLQGWQLTQDDWQTIIPEDSEENALLGGVLLSVSMLYDPETALITLKEEGVTGLDAFEEIYHALPTMLIKLTELGHTLKEKSDH